ncbi:hypothetical protein [Paenibacillus sp. YN15]|uniref:hypothetical protein n=1 Tax=Paenibacillus sp. YN15 TaxID=1742774 RepID=UPI000DCC4389|nr:hypothetical protein [Paenibacillus sp. YN15]RAV06563.1 hypothetical protein DQG13_01645 [Paenibacillus sp. YN15]
MDETRQLLHAILKNQELTNAKLTATQDELLHFRKETTEKFTQIDCRLDSMDSRLDKMDARMDETNKELAGFKAETAENFRQLHERMDENAFEQRKEKRHRESLERDLDKLTERMEKVEEYIGFEHQ